MNLLTSIGVGVGSLAVAGDTNAWNTKWSTYVTDNTSPAVSQDAKDIWELSDWSAKKGSKDSAPQTFKDKCRELAKKVVKDTNDITYQKVSKYCTK